MIDKATYKKLLAGITPETIQDAHEVMVFINDELSENVGTDIPKLSDALKSVFVGALLIEYGKIHAGTDNRGEQ